MASSASAPWTAEEIRKNASSWTLEGDAKLLEFMQSISNNLENRATKTTANIHKLALDVDRTKISLDNVTNQLAALQHTQFVENRVYEDDETIANISEVPVSDEADDSAKYDPIETLTLLLNQSMAVVDRNYEKVSIDIEDSDEEDDTPKSIIYRPKDPYENKALPFIIGSKEWTEKWHIGLCDSDEDFSGDEKEDEFSESSESASISASLPSNAPTMSESELSAWGLQQNSGVEKHIKRRLAGYISSEEDASVATKESFEDNRYRPNNRAKQMPYHNNALPLNDDSAANQYYIHQPKQKDGGLFDESSDESTDSELYNVHGKSERTIPYPPIRKNNMAANIFTDEPPPDLDVVDQRAESRSDLFCESEEETVASQKKLTPTVVKKEEPVMNNIRKKTVNLFDDDDFDSFMKELNTKTQSKSGAADKQVRNLFDESSGEEEIQPPQISENRIKPSEKTKQNRELASKEKIEVPSKVEVDIPPKKLISEEIPQQINVKKENFKPTSYAVPKNQSLFVNLFDDDPPDDDFDSLFNENKSSNQTDSHGVAKRKTKLFDDVDDENEITKDYITETRKDSGLSVADSESQIIVRNVEDKASEIETQENVKINDEPATTAPRNKNQELNYSKIFADESDDDESDLFSNRKNVDAIKNMSPVNSSTNLTATVDEEQIHRPYSIDHNSEDNNPIEKDSLKENSTQIETKETKLFTNNSFSNSCTNEASLDKIESTGIETDSTKSSEDALPSEDYQNSKGLPTPLFSNLFNYQSEDEPSDLLGSKLYTSSSKDLEGKLLNQTEDALEHLSENTLGRQNENKKIKDNSSEIDSKDSDCKVDEAVTSINKLKQTNRQMKLKQSTQHKLENIFFEDDPEPDVFADEIPDSKQLEPPSTLFSGGGLIKTSDEGNSDKEAKKAVLDAVNDKKQISDEYIEHENHETFNKSQPKNTPKVGKENPIESAERNQIFSTILFNDVPPNDDESYIDRFESNLEGLEKYREEIPDKTDQPSHIQSSGVGYNAFNLFHDIPPDDDFEATPQDGKKLHNIFYDDFSETIIPSQIETKPKSLSSFIFDEPPPDSFQEDSEDSVDRANKSKDEVSSFSRFDSDTKIGSIIDRMQRNVDEPDKVIPPKNVPQPKKLNANLNINVAALLPGAKRPTFRGPEVEIKNEEVEKEGKDLSSDVERVKNIAIDSKPKIVHTESDPSMLQSLNKSRVKIQVKRKPSTRRGRQENYRRSMVQEDEIDEDEDGSYREQVISGSNINSELFDDQALFPKILDNTLKNNTPEDISIATVPSDQDNTTNVTKEHVKAKPSTEANILPDEEPPLEYSAPSTISKMTNNPASSLFLEDDNENDALFTAEALKATVATATIIKSQIEKPKVIAVKPRSGLLFEDESDDDLFGASKSSSTDSKLNTNKQNVQPQLVNKVKQSQPQKVAKSIFGSDDDDEDLFGGAIKSDSSKTKKAGPAPKSLRVDSTSQGRLFDGDEDDEDLFAGGDSKLTNTRSSNTKRTESRKPSQPISNHKNFQDPLADLFKD